MQAEGVGSALSVKGLGDVEMGWPSAHVVALEDGNPARYEMTNGHTFFIDRILQDSYKSVYYTMADAETHEPMRLSINCCRATNVYGLILKRMRTWSLFLIWM